VVIENRRAPIVTQMVWYKAGAADEVQGVSGIAHFLEHLMFKGTTNLAPGEFNRIVARYGGRDNAFTGHDYTAYFQSVSRDRLEAMMRIEADRMANLTLAEGEVLSERDVILEERRQVVDQRPSSRRRCSPTIPMGGRSSAGNTRSRRSRAATRSTGTRAGTRPTTPC
jgi:zinc protease